MKQLENHIKEFTSEYYKTFKQLLSKPQFENFKIMCKGILHGMADAEKIARIFSTKDPSTIRKFMSYSPWDENEINKARIAHANQILNQKFMKYIPIAIDDSINTKYGKLIPGSGYYFSNKLDKTVWSQTVVTSHLTIGDHDIPLNWDLYFKKKHCEENVDLNFRSKIDIAMDQIKKILKQLKLQKNQIGVVTADSWYPAAKLINQIIASSLEAVLAVKCNRKVIYNGKEIRVDELAQQLSDMKEDQFEEMEVNDTKFRVWEAKVGMEDIDQEEIRLVINQHQFGEGNQTKWSDFDYLIVTDLNMRAWTALFVYQKRWNIETFYKFGKERLAFDKSRTQTEKTLSRFFILLFCVYTMISLSGFDLYAHHIPSKSKYEVQEKLVQGLKKELIVWVYIQSKNEITLEQILLQLGLTEKIA